MYETFFNLSHAPFSMTPDPQFLYATETHQEALSGLIYAIRERKGFMVLTGESGTGKTTLINTALGALSDLGVHSSWIVNPSLTPSEFLELALLDFGLTDLPESKAQRIVEFQKFLIDSYERGKLCVLIIDEAHKLAPAVLEEIRLLTNFETGSAKLLQIVLAGQTELNPLLDRPDLRQLKQRIAVRVTVKQLEPAQVPAYIECRWQRAGGTLPAAFTPEAVAAIAQCSAGIPRLINSLCDSSLLIAFAEFSNQVTLTNVNEAALDLRLNSAVHLSPNGNGHGASPVVPADSPERTAASLGIKSLRLPPPPKTTESISMPTLERYLPPPPQAPLGMRWAMKLGIARVKKVKEA
jgi:general secretion pathway protein A